MRNRAHSRRDSRRKGIKSYDNNPKVGVAFAGLLGLAVLFGLGFLANDMVTDALHPRAEATTPLPPAPPATNDPTDPFFDRVSYFSASDLPRVDAQVLVVSDLSDSSEHTMGKHLESAVSMMNDFGIKSIGEMTETPDSFAIEHLASLRNQIGAVPSDSQEVITTTSQWLSDHEDLDAVLMFITDPESGSDHAVLVGEFFSSVAPMDREMLNHIVRNLHGNGFAAIPN